ncbi:hypothetical protein CAEBREN_03058 [Caenorhabditis brenneri]|uniref:Uncharacterized protein n=1 Tax=Caenorhabditis brenneri TaxID=135651 RepID=G0NZC6_CAEBE|nr:hypothetical protein CAEBREN_03058 [Caenorhabditis brenneri]
MNKYMKKNPSAVIHRLLYENEFVKEAIEETAYKRFRESLVKAAPGTINTYAIQMFFDFFEQGGFGEKHV